MLIKDKKPMTSIRFGQDLLTFFDHLYIINLPEREDRRRQMLLQLQSIGLSFVHPKVTLFPATRAETTAGFPSIGAHGCFLSHLRILCEARARGYQSVLIAEDDLEFVIDNRNLATLLQPLRKQPWQLFFGGYHYPTRFTADGVGLIDIGQRYNLGGGHLYAVSSRAFDALISYLEAALDNPPPRPHLDVALSDFRKTQPECITLVVSPAIGIQRRSRSDIQALRFYDRIQIFRPLTDLLRRLLGMRRS